MYACPVTGAEVVTVSAYKCNIVSLKWYTLFRRVVVVVRAHAHTRTHTHTISSSCAQPPLHTLTPILIHIHVHIYVHTCPHTYPYAYTPTLAGTRTHTHTRAHTRTRAHTQCTQLHVTVLTHTLFTSARAPTTPNVALNPTLSHSLIPCSVLRNCTGLWDLSVVPVLLLC
jgi:hypothetical protein